MRHSNTSRVDAVWHSQVPYDEVDPVSWSLVNMCSKHESNIRLLSGSPRLTPRWIGNQLRALYRDQKAHVMTDMQSNTLQWVLLLVECGPQCAVVDGVECFLEVYSCNLRLSCHSYDSSCSIVCRVQLICRAVVVSKCG